MSKPRVLAVAKRFAPSMNNAILSAGEDICELAVEEEGLSYIRIF